MFVSYLFCRPFAAGSWIVTCCAVDAVDAVAAAVVAVSAVDAVAILLLLLSLSSPRLSLMWMVFLIPLL